MYFVYLIKCENPKNSKISYYCGYTNNPNRRFREHTTGNGAKYTKSHLPLEMRVIDRFESRKKAMRNEIKIKKRSKSYKVKLFRKSNSSIS
ncbi:MAG: GIY-YIG nuclease family protein [Candidatus Lokiarchaeota archaeon]|nr:GIY-YIG nuclease family protein [Candidatus Lokiarchaeota archaeon]